MREKKGGYTVLQNRFAEALRSMGLPDDDYDEGLRALRHEDAASLAARPELRRAALGEEQLATLVGVLMQQAAKLAPAHDEL